MRAFAQEIVSRAVRLFAGPHSELWSVTVGGRPVGLLARDGNESRLSWFEPADPRLTSYAGPLPATVEDGDLEAFAAALSLRLGRQVELDSLPV